MTILGNIQKIETRQTQTGKSITTVNVSAGEKNAKDEYDNLYIKADFWEKQSDFVSQYFKEGDVIAVTGKLVTTNYKNTAGINVYETKFLFPQASFVPKSKSDNTSQSNDNSQNNHSYGQPNTSTPPPAQNTPQNQQGALPTIEIDSDSIPFSHQRTWWL